MHVPKDLRTKVVRKIGQLVGYERRNQYRIWNTYKHTAELVSFVVFDEASPDSIVVEISTEGKQEDIGEESESKDEQEDQFVDARVNPASYALPATQSPAVPALVHDDDALDIRKTATDRQLRIQTWA
jgi:hypothetical protein